MQYFKYSLQYVSNTRIVTIVATKQNLSVTLCPILIINNKAHVFLTAFFGLTGTQKPQKDKDFVIEGKQADPACFHICGDSLTRVDHAKQLISDLITNQQFSNSIKDNAILSLSDPDRQRIRDMEATMDVSVTLEYASSQAVITVEGMSKDVSKTTNEIHEMLRRAREQEAFNKNVEMIGSMTEWQHQQQGGPFVNFDPVSNFHLEDGFQKKRAYVEVNLQGQIYKVLLPDGPGTDAQGNTLQIRRIDKLAGSLFLVQLSTHSL